MLSAGFCWQSIGRAWLEAHSPGWRGCTQGGGCIPAGLWKFCWCSQHSLGSCAASNLPPSSLLHRWEPSLLSDEDQSCLAPDCPPLILNSVQSPSSASSPNASKRHCAGYLKDSCSPNMCAYATGLINHQFLGVGLWETGPLRGALAHYFAWKSS